MMKRKVVLKEEGKLVKKDDITVRDEQHLEAKIKYPHRIQLSKKKYNRKKLKNMKSYLP
jgi:hypothetical protein